MTSPSKRRTLIWAGLFIFLAAGGGFLKYGRSFWVPVYQSIAGKRTVNDILLEYGPSARELWRGRLREYAIDYPPNELTLVAIKDARVLEVWTRDGDRNVQLASYPVLAASGQLGPKLREGDLQVPEGLYRIEGLNPNSAFHLSMKVNYPNEFDRARAAEEGRNNPGSDIFIHGKRASIGCLAMGDPAIEELFVLVADTGHENTKVIIAPCDFRLGCSSPATGLPWVPGLYDQIRARLADYVIELP